MIIQPNVDPRAVLRCPAFLRALCFIAAGAFCVTFRGDFRVAFLCRGVNLTFAGVSKNMGKRLKKSLCHKEKRKGM